MNPTLVENLKAELTKTRGQLAELAILQKRERALINLLQEYDPQPLGTISSLHVGQCEKSYVSDARLL